MSIPVHDIVIDPKTLSSFQDVAGLLSSSFFDASPIYANYEVDYSISGSVTEGSIDYDYDYSNSKTWTRVPFVGSGEPQLIIPDDGLFTDLNILHVDLFSRGSLGASDFTMAALQAIRSSSELGDLYNPKKPAATFNFGGLTDIGYIEENVVIGTKTDNDPDPAVETDIVANIYFINPSFYINGGLVGDRGVMDTFTLGGISIEIGTGVQVQETVSGWTNSQWKDFKGTYNNSGIVSNGSSIDVTVTIG